MKKLISATLASALFLSACAQSADSIQPTYVSPMEYRDFSCDQVSGELRRVTRRMNEVAGIQDETASEDAWATGIGIVLFWPALFFINSSDQEAQLGRLKGEFDALEQSAVQKNCDVADEIQKAREMQEERRSKEQESRNEAQQYN